MQKAVIGSCYKSRTRCFETASKNIVHKISEIAGEIIGNKIADNIVKRMCNIYSRNNDDVVIPPQKREKILNELRQVL